MISIVFSLALNGALRSLCMWMSEQEISLSFRDLRTKASAGPFGVNIGHSLQIVFSGLWIVLTFPLFFKDYGVVTWLLLANLYVHRLVFGYGPADFPFSGFYLVMVAVTAYHLGLSHRRQLGHLVHRYWMVVTFGICFFSTPGLRGSLNLHPPEDWYERERYILVEAVFIIAWLTGGEHMVDPAIITDDRLGWVHLWAMVVFPLMLGFHWLFPWPLSWLSLAALGPFCCFFHRSA